MAGFTFEIELLCSPVLVGVDGGFFAVEVDLASGFVFGTVVDLLFDVVLAGAAPVFGVDVFTVLVFTDVVGVLAAGLLADAFGVAGLVAALVFGVVARLAVGVALVAARVFVVGVAGFAVVALGVLLAAGLAAAL